MTIHVHQDLQLAPVPTTNTLEAPAPTNARTHPADINALMSEVIRQNKLVLRRTLHLYPPYLRPYLLKLG